MSANLRDTRAIKSVHKLIRLPFFAIFLILSQIAAASEVPLTNIDYIDLDRGYSDSAFLESFPKELVGKQKQNVYWVEKNNAVNFQTSKYFPEEYKYIFNKEGGFLGFSQGNIDFVPQGARPYQDSKVLHSLMMTSSGWNEERRHKGSQTDYVHIQGHRPVFVKHQGKNLLGDLGLQISDYALELFETRGEPKYFSIVPEFFHAEIETRQYSLRDTSVFEKHRSSGEVLIPVHSLVAWVKNPKQYSSEIEKYLGVENIKQWHRSEWIPKFSRALVEANFRYGLYPNAHGQNTLALVDPKSAEVKRIFYRDIEDFSLDFSVLKEKEKNIKAFKELQRRPVSRIGYKYLGEDSNVARDAALKNYVFSEQSLLGLDWDIATRFIESYLGAMNKELGIDISEPKKLLNDLRSSSHFSNEDEERLSDYKKSLGDHFRASAFILAASISYLIPAGVLDLVSRPFKKTNILAKANRNVELRLNQIYEPIHFNKSTLPTYWVMQEAYRAYHQNKLSKLRDSLELPKDYNVILQEELKELVQEERLEFIDVAFREKIMDLVIGKPDKGAINSLEKRGSHFFVVHDNKVVAYSNTAIYSCKKVMR